MSRPRRALWLLNHSTLREFEVPLLVDLGYEVFTPKSFPVDEGNLSASIDYSYDKTLTISSEDLEALNRINFYEEFSSDATALLNRHFEIAFFAFFPRQMSALVRSFKGTLVMRPFGLSRTSYTDVTRQTLGAGFFATLQKVEQRFWFGQAYPHLQEIETGIFRRKAVTLPLGLANLPSSQGRWTGEDRRLLFVCPRIGSSSYYRAIYDRFQVVLGDIPHTIAGAQPIPVPDGNVSGYLTRPEYDLLLQRSRVMFYQSQEERHLHYHPLEAIQRGQPLIFMAGGMLDRLGGSKMPGRSRTGKDARQMILRILDGERGFTAEVLESQTALLAGFQRERCEAEWRVALGRMLQARDLVETTSPQRTRRVAILIPVGYRGGTLRGAKLLARAIELGAHARGESIEVVFGHLDDPDLYVASEFDDLPQTIKRRPFRWKVLDPREVARASAYAGVEGATVAESYQAPDDGVGQFLDCDLWIVVSDRLELPLLPLRPYLVMVYDYLQRYSPLLDDHGNRRFLARAHAAEAVMVTTNFTARDARQFAGIAPAKIRKVPMLAPQFSMGSRDGTVVGEPPSYFLWTTNLAVQKNHKNALLALQLYYEEFQGVLGCHVVGVGTSDLLKGGQPHLAELSTIVRASPTLKSKLRIQGELPDREYHAQLRKAAFLWHPASIDNGTFSVIEAARSGVPALSSDYPAMREIDEQFGLGLMWMDSQSPSDMARKLKQIELDVEVARARVPTAERLATQSLDRLAGAYWDVVREFL